MSRLDGERIERPVDELSRDDKLENLKEIYSTYSEFYGLRDTDPKLNDELKNAWRVLAKNECTPEVDEAREKYPNNDLRTAYFKVLTEKYDGIPTPEHGELQGSFVDRIRELGHLKGFESPSFDAACDRYEEKMHFVPSSGMFGFIRDMEDKPIDIFASMEMGAFIRTLDADSKLELIPKTSQESAELSLISDTDWRDDFMRPLTGYVNINMETMDQLAYILEDKKCLEVMAGNGLLSRCLQDREVDVIATDKSLPIDNKYFPLRTEAFTEIRQMDAIDAIREYGKDIDVLIMSWPPYGDDIASRCVEELHDVNPNAEILYIGESFGGCTANDDFFDKVERVEWDEDMHDLYDSYTPFNGLHDNFEFYRYAEDDIDNIDDLY